MTTLYLSIGDSFPLSSIVTLRIPLIKLSIIIEEHGVNLIKFKIVNSEKKYLKYL